MANNRKFSWDFTALKRFYDRYVVKWLHSDMDWDDNVKRQARSNLGIHSAGGSLGVYTLAHNTTSPFDGRVRYILPYDWDKDSHSQRLVLRLEGDWSEEEKWVLVLAEGSTPTNPTDSFILPIEGTITAGSYIDVARTGDRVKAVVMDEAPDIKTVNGQSLLGSGDITTANTYNLFTPTPDPYSGAVRCVYAPNWDNGSTKHRIVLCVGQEWDAAQKNVYVIGAGATQSVPTTSFILPINGTIPSNTYVDVVIDGSVVKASIIGDSVDLSNYYTKTQTDTLLGQKINASEKGADNGVCPLDEYGMVDTTYLHTGVPYGVPYLMGNNRIPVQLIAMTLTRAEYDALTVKDSDTIYFIY